MSLASRLIKKLDESRTVAKVITFYYTDEYNKIYKISYNPKTDTVKLPKEAKNSDYSRALTYARAVYMSKN